MSNKEMRRIDEFYHRRLWKNPRSIIESVHGFYLAGGCNLLAHADMIIASEDSVRISFNQMVHFRSSDSYASVFLAQKLQGVTHDRKYDNYNRNMYDLG